MRILIDADGCPVVDMALELAKRYCIEVIIFCDTSHVFENDGAETIIVPKGSDSVDFKLVNMAHPGDIVITQDYGLAAMCLAKKAVLINQNGMLYTEKNIDSLLSFRHISKKIRSSGGKLKGPNKRTQVQNKSFKAALEQLLIAFPGMEEKSN